MPLTVVSTQTAGGVASAAGFANVVKGNFDALIAGWTAYTPTVTNITIGNGGISAAYMIMGKTCFLRFELFFGSTTTVAATASFSLPFTSKSGPDQGLAGAAIHVTSLAIVNGRIPSATTTCQLVAATAPVGATVPFTWAANDSIGISGVYETA